MIYRLCKGISTAGQAACAGFVRACKHGHSIDQVLGYVDELTGIPNRNAFERDKHRLGMGCSVIMIDIDGLKQLNDTKGHLYGDEVLRSMGRILRDATRAAGRAYRYAGDEFVLVVPRSDADAVSLAVQTRTLEEGMYTISVGVLKDSGACAVNEAIVFADAALYQSKTQGRNRITVTFPALAAEA